MLQLRRSVSAERVLQSRQPLQTVIERVLTGARNNASHGMTGLSSTQSGAMMQQLAPSCRVHAGTVVPRSCLRAPGGAASAPAAVPPAANGRQLRLSTVTYASDASQQLCRSRLIPSAARATCAGRHTAAASVPQVHSAGSASQSEQHHTPAAAACNMLRQPPTTGHRHQLGVPSSFATHRLAFASQHPAISQRRMNLSRHSGRLATSAEPPDRGPQQHTASSNDGDAAANVCATLPRHEEGNSDGRASDSNRSGASFERQPHRQQWQSQQPSQQQQQSLRRGMSAGLEPSDVKASDISWRERIATTIRATVLTYYTAFFYNTVIRLLKLLGADAFFARITPKLEVAYATVSGTWHVFPDGRRRPYSLANNYDPDFSIPPQYCSEEFPFGAEDRPSVYRTDMAHFLSLAMKLVYEHNDVIEDIIQRDWGLEPLAIIETAPLVKQEREQRKQQKQQRESHSSADLQDSSVEEVKPAQGKDSDFLPSSKVIVMRSRGAIVIAFRGTEATNLLNWRTNLTLQMTCHKDLGGVHDGFYAALFHRPGPHESSLFEDLVACLKDAAASDAEGGEAGQEEPIYLTGHSLGGALSNVFAQGLAAQEPEMAERVAGVYTWGEPRVGDAAFKQRWVARYGDRSFRVRNAGDIVPYLLPKWLGYRHKPKELFFTSFCGMKSDPKEIRRWALIENVGFPFLYVYKIFAGRLGRRRETWLRTLYRVGFSFTAPGFMDHFPCEYERKARYSLEQGAGSYGEAGSIADRK